ncbi:MAG: HTH domain-containing protein [Clostridium sp.]
MKNKKYSSEEKEILLKNINIERVTDKQVTFTKEFKLYAAKQSIENKKFPTEIFLEAGIDIKIIGADAPKDCLRRWRNKYKEQGPASLLENATRVHKNKKAYISDKDKLKQAEARIKYLESENEFLKKIQALERMVK